MGILSWVRSFTLVNVVSFLPLAITYTRLKGDHYQAASKFMFLVQWWGMFAGSATTFVNVVLGGFLAAGRLSESGKGV